MPSSLPQDKQKELLAKKAIEKIKPDMVLGLGTGSTIDYFMAELARRNSHLSSIKIISTSKASTEKANNLGLRILDPSSDIIPDITVDGADEVSRDLNMIKGGGGALLWEKIVSKISCERIYLADETKLVKCLGKFPLPIEVVPYGHEWSGIMLGRLMTEVQLRLNDDGEVFKTDSGNVIYDCKMPFNADVTELDTNILAVPGTVVSGLFVGFVNTLITITKDEAVIVRELSDVFW